MESIDKDQLKSFVDKKSAQFAMDIKATTIAPTGFSEVDSTDVVISAGRRQTAKDIFPVGSVSYESYNQLVANRSGVPASVAPGSTYPEIDGNPSKVTYAVEDVASFTDIHRNTLK